MAQFLSFLCNSKWMVRNRSVIEKWHYWKMHSHTKGFPKKMLKVLDYACFCKCKIETEMLQFDQEKEKKYFLKVYLVWYEPLSTIDNLKVATNLLIFLDIKLKWIPQIQNNHMLQYLLTRGKQVKKRSAQCHIKS